MKKPQLDDFYKFKSKFLFHVIKIIDSSPELDALDVCFIARKRLEEELSLALFLYVFWRPWIRYVKVRKFLFR